jgi:serine/threonine-protein kinase
VDYVAPEQVEGRQTDHRADIYSLGCVLYECLTGTVPYPRDGEVAVLFAHVQDAVPRVTDSRPDLPSAVDEIVARAMAKLPERRYANATDISHDLMQTVGASRYSHAVPLPAEYSAGPVVSGPSGVTAPPPAAPPADADAARGAVPPPTPTGAIPASDGEHAAGGPQMPPRARQSLLVTGLAVALLAALGVIGYQVLGSGGSSKGGASSTGTSTGTSPSGSGGGPITAFTGPAKPGDLQLVMPKALLADCTSGPAGGAVAALNCTAPNVPGLTYEISLYRNTADLKDAYNGIITAQGIQPNSNGCTKRSWRGERAWLHPTGKPGGRVACYLDVNNNSVIVWMHMSQNEKGAPPQQDHRDILGIARVNSQLPGALLTWWKFWGGSSPNSVEIIGKLQT